jgi:hypothetical protein
MFRWLILPFALPIVIVLVAAFLISFALERGAHA